MQEYSPIFNRALLAEYWPGSIYKMVTAIAAIDYGHIGQYYEIEDKGVYEYYKDEGYTPQCYIVKSAGHTHGKINMQEALQESCNYYFYEVGRLTYYGHYAETGENAMDIVAKALGLGEPTGVELYENTGMRANAETKKELYSGTDAGWYGADVIQAAIGQSDNKFTPMQMASYTAAVANGGVRYRSTLLSRVVSWDYQELLAEHEPEVLSTLEMSDEAKECVMTGMRLAATKGTGAQYLKDYPIPRRLQERYGAVGQHGLGFRPCVLRALRACRRPRDRHLRLCGKGCAGRLSRQCLHPHSRCVFLRVQPIRDHTERKHGNLTVKERSQ